MKLQRIYIDTSVIGGCFDQEFKIWSEKLFADFAAGVYAPVISETVSAEIEGAPDNVKELFDELLSLDPEILLGSEESLTLVDAYLGHQILSEKYRNDMLHIALATIGNVDIIVSWNFRHIVRHDKIIRFNAVNLEYGYKQLSIHSPREVTTYGKD